MGPSQEKRTPFVGPRAIQKGELLFGRDREVSDLVDLLFSERIVLLHSPSGAGKSSLVNAGLIPALEAEYLWILPVIRLNNELPEDLTKHDELAKVNRYVLNTMLSLEPALPDSGQSTPADLATISLDQYLAAHEGRIDPDEALLLIFDQFEEVLTLDPLDLDAKHEFFRQLGEALRNPQRPRWALFVIREDYVGSLDPYLQPIPTQLSVRMRLDLLSKEAARQAIQRPRPTRADEDLHLLTENFTREAAKKLAADLAQICVQQLDDSRLLKDGLHVEPVHLQVVCERLWREAQERGESQVGIDALTEVSTVNKALAGYFSEKVEAIADQRGVPERRIRRWFDQHLITAQGIRGQVMRDVGESKGLDNKVIEDLINAYLVRQERRRGVTWFELAHDRLIEPVRDNNAAWQEDKLTEEQRTASVWDKEGRPEGFFLRGKELREFERWERERRRIDPSWKLEPHEKEFLTVSQARRKGERWRKIAAIGFVVMSIVAVIAAVSAWNLARVSFQEKLTAEDAATSAKMAADTAKQQQAEAEVAATSAQMAADTAKQQQATAEVAAISAQMAADTSKQQQATAQMVLNRLVTSESNARDLDLTAEISQNKLATATAAADQLRQTVEAVGTPMTMTLEQRQTVEVLQAAATAAEAEAERLRSTAEVASTAAVAAKQTAEMERRLAIMPLVEVQGTEFVRAGERFRFMGVNLRGLVHYGTPQYPFASQREQLTQAQAMSARVVRVFLPHKDVPVEETRSRLERLLDLLRDEFPEIYLIVALTDMYAASQHFPQGDERFYRTRTELPGGTLGREWFEGGYKENYLPFVETIVSAYKDEPRIFAWEIGEELRLPDDRKLFIDFTHAVAERIKQLDANHLVATGMRSTRQAGLQVPDQKKLYGSPHIDFVTSHIYNAEYGDDDSALAAELNKPYLVEEAGFEAGPGDDRSEQIRQDMDTLFGRGARGYMQWAFMAGEDNGDGDSDSGMDSVFHSDWDSLFQVYLQGATELLLTLYDLDGTERDWEWLTATFGTVTLERGTGTASVIALRAVEGAATLVVHVEDAEGSPLDDVPVVWYWPDAPKLPSEMQACGLDRGVVGRTSSNGDVGFGMGQASYYFPSGGQIGPHVVWVGVEGTDCLGGMGMLGGTEHMHLNSVWRMP